MKDSLGYHGHPPFLLTPPSVPCDVHTYVFTKSPSLILTDINSSADGCRVEQAVCNPIILASSPSLWVTWLLGDVLAYCLYI